MKYIVEIEGNTPDELLSAFVEDIAYQFHLDETNVIEAIHNTPARTIIGARPIEVVTYQGLCVDVLLQHIKLIKRGNPYDTLVMHSGERIFIQPNNYLFRRWKLFNANK